MMKKNHNFTRNGFAKYLEQLTKKQYNNLLSIIYEQYLPTQCQRIDACDLELLSNIVSLCVGTIEDVSLSKNTVMTRASFDPCSNKPRTIEGAMNMSLLFQGKDGLYVPVVLLRKYSNLCGSSNTLVLLKHLDGIMNNRDNETLYVSVVLHRMRVFSLMGLKTVRLSRVLGVELTRYQDILIKVNENISEYKYSKTENENITSKNFGKSFKTTGSVNTPNAPFADAWITFIDTNNRKFYVFIQEKQSTITRANLEAGYQPLKITKTSVAKELTKVINVNKTLDNKNHLFIHISDQEIKNETAKTDSRNTICITSNTSKRAFGAIVSSLKSFATSSSSIDTQTTSSKTRLQKRKRENEDQDNNENDTRNKQSKKQEPNEY
jgi:hypothetical protein